MFELGEAYEDPKIKSEARCLAEYELEHFEFFQGMTIWFDILFAINSVSKTLQSEDMHIEIAIDQLRGLITYYQNYRENGFTNAIISAKEIANEMEIEPKFREKRVIHR